MGQKSLDLLDSSQMVIAISYVVIKALLVIRAESINTPKLRASVLGLITPLPTFNKNL